MKINTADENFTASLKLFKKVFVFSSLDSTNDWCYQTDYTGNFIVRAEEQTKGRGRQGRKWYSPPGENLYFSFSLIQPAVSTEHLCMITALSCMETLRLCAPGVMIKWPNDLIFQGRKLGGVLIEHSWQGRRTERAVAGIGININTDFALSPGLRDKAASLAEITCGRVDPDEIFEGIVRRFEDYLMGFPGNKSAVSHTWQRNTAGKGERVQFKQAGETVTGRLVSVNTDGSVTLCEGNRRKTYHFGEII
jgi:BirA family biotin operon repressor/biotin-[acetyl-CoA-carboxylase] ligase